MHGCQNRPLFYSKGRPVEDFGFVQHRLSRFLFSFLFHHPECSSPQLIWSLAVFCLCCASTGNKKGDGAYYCVKA